MDDSSHSDIPLPPPEKPVTPLRKWSWFFIVLIFVLALIAASAWYCTTIIDIPPPPCTPMPPTLDASPEIIGKDCPQGVTHAYRCAPLLEKARGFFAKDGR